MYLHTEKDSLFGSKHVFRVRCDSTEDPRPHDFVAEVKAGRPIPLTCDMCIEREQLRIKALAMSMTPPEV